MSPILSPPPSSFDLSAQAILDALDGVSWLVDPAGRIRAVGAQNWAGFAAANGAAALADPATVIGRPIDDFIEGEGVRAFWRHALRDILVGERGSIVLPCGCDAPDIGREMRMTMSPVRAGGEIESVLFQSVTLSEHQRPPVNLYDYKALLSALEEDRTLPILTMCSLCQQVRHPPGSDDASGVWIAAEEHYRRGGTSQVRISHGVCGECRSLLGSVRANRLV